MAVMLVWNLDVDPSRLDEARELVAVRREQVRRHSCRDLRVYMVTEGDRAGGRVVAIEEFDTHADLESFRASQPLDEEAQATIAATLAPVGPFTVVDMVVVDELSTTDRRTSRTCSRRLPRGTVRRHLTSPLSNPVRVER